MVNSPLRTKVVADLIIPTYQHEISVNPGFNGLVVYGQMKSFLDIPINDLSSITGFKQSRFVDTYTNVIFRKKYSDRY
jgi:hypothetical protein